MAQDGAFGLVANTDTKLLIYHLFQKVRILAQDGVRIGPECLNLTVPVGDPPLVRNLESWRRSRNSRRSCAPQKVDPLVGSITITGCHALPD